MMGYTIMINHAQNMSCMNDCECVLSGMEVHQHFAMFVVHAILGRNGRCRGARAEGSYLLVAFCHWTSHGIVDGSKLDTDSDNHLLFGFHGFNEAPPAKGRPCFLGRWQLERIRVQVDSS